MNLLLAEYATQYPDGTRTIVRGGLTRFAGVLPFQMNPYIWIEIPAHDGRKNPLKLSIRVNIGDKPLMFGEAQVELEKPEQEACISLPMPMTAHEYGDAVVTVDIEKNKKELKFSIVESL